MKLHFILVLLTSVAAQVHALKCYDCEEHDYQEDYYEKECFNLNMIRNNCTGAKYCETTFTVVDGITTEVHRGCGYEEKTTGEGWYIDNYYSGSWSKFYKYCNEKDVCNNDPPSGFKTCSKECINGACDYIIGECACYSGYKGDICNTTDDTSAPIIRKCHQCNSDYDGVECENEVTGEGSICLNGEKYCSISRTTLFDIDLIARKNVTARGCTDSTVILPDCVFDRTYSDALDIHSYWKYTCFETCDTDSCNQKLSVEVADGEDNSMFCVQCSTTQGSCSPSPSRCPYGTKYCLSTVQYTISAKADFHNDEGDPSFEILNVVRGCATESVAAECKEEQIVGADSVKKVTCSETCEQDGCNDGWPVRPKCVICDSDDWYRCIESPPFPKSCDRPYERYCYIHDEKMRTTGANSGYARRMVRDCSQYDRGNTCTSTQIGDTEIESCNRTCTSYGCNIDSGGEIPLQTLLYVLLVALSANVLQNMK